MPPETNSRDLGIASRMSRTKGRGSRDQMANARVTTNEKSELETAAKLDGKSLSEWSREVLLREARKGKTDAALFTELVALRSLLNTVLRPIAVGDKLTPETYARMLAEVRSSKHETAKEVLAQYERPSGGR